MASAGWYPDPSGIPGAFRYWDGQAWSHETSTGADGPPPAPPGQRTTPPTTPPSPPASPPALGGYEPTYVPGAGPSPTPPPPPSQSSPPTTGGPQYGAYGQGGTGWTTPPAQPPGGQPGWGPMPGASPSPSGSGRTVLLVVGAVVLVLVLAAGAFVGVRAIAGGDDSAGGGDPPPTVTDTITGSTTDSPGPTMSAPGPTTSAPSPGPTVSPTSAECKGGNPGSSGVQVAGNALSSGGITMTKPVGYSLKNNASLAFVFADAVVAPSKIIETKEEGAGWIATYAVGGLDRSHGFTDPEQAAGAILTCMAQSKQFYDHFSSRTDLTSQAVTVDGAAGWEVSAEIRVDLPGLKVEGDVAKVVVVDAGDPSGFGLFVSVVPIGDDALIRQQDKIAGSLRLQ